MKKKPKRSTRQSPIFTFASAVVWVWSTLACFVPVSSPADDLPTQSARDRLDDSSFKELLSTGDYQDRQQATLEMWRGRDRSRAIVQQASRDPDPEVSGRARWVLQQWQRGILADTPPDLAKKLQAMLPSQTIDTLMSVGRFNAVVVAFEESAGTSEWQERRDQIESLILTKYPLYVYAADQRGELDGLVTLMGQVAKTRAMAISRVELLRSTGIAINDDQLLPAAAEYWSDADRLVGLVQILVVLGRVDDAIELLSIEGVAMNATSFGISIDATNDHVQQRRSQLREVCFLLGQQWRRLCDELSARETPPSDPTYDLVWYHSRLLIAADRCGDSVARQRALTGLNEFVDRAVAPESPSESSAFEQRLVWSTLVMHGHIDLANRLLETTDRSMFAELAYATSDPLLALQRLGFPVAELEPRLAEIVANCSVLQGQEDQDQESSISLAKLQSLFRFLFAAGRNDLAWQLCNQIARVPVREGNPSDITPRELLAFYLRPLGRPKWKEHFQLYPGQQELTNRTIGVMVGRGDGVVDYAMWRRLNETFRLMMPNSDLRQRSHWISQLSDGDVPPEFREGDLPARLYRELTKPSKDDDDPFTEDAGDRPVVLPIGYADLFLGLGRSDLWLRCTQALQATGDLGASLRLADWVRRTGRTDDAAEMYSALMEVVGGDEAGAGLVSVPEAVKIALAVPIKQRSLATAVQDAATKQQCERLIDLLACSPAPTHRRTLLQLLDDEGDDDLLGQMYRRLLAFMAMEQDDVTDFVEVTGEYATMIHEDQPEEAAKWMELRLVAMIRHTDGYGPSTYLANAAICEGFRLESAMKRDDVTAITQSIARIEQLDPLEIDHLEGVLPSVTEAGHRTIAEDTLDRMIENANEYFSRGHCDAGKLNNLAWSLAVNDHRLDVALRWSRRSVAIEPDTAIYRDTLAEILFRQGKVDQAIQIEQACLLDSPGEHHLYEQIERFQASR